MAMVMEKPGGGSVRLDDAHGQASLGVMMAHRARIGVRETRGKDQCAQLQFLSSAAHSSATRRLCQQIG
jgi:hypothetical protein